LATIRGPRSPDFRSNWADEYRLKRPNTLAACEPLTLATATTQALGVAAQSAYCREYGLWPRCHVESPSSEVLGHAVRADVDGRRRDRPHHLGELTDASR